MDMLRNYWKARVVFIIMVIPPLSLSLRTAQALTFLRKPAVLRLAQQPSHGYHTSSSAWTAGKRGQNRRDLWTYGNRPPVRLAWLPSPDFSMSTSRRLFSSPTQGIKRGGQAQDEGEDDEDDDDWEIPESLDIPEDKLEISFVRSSGAGGQNVNKVNTQVQLRFHVRTATWIPKEVRDRLHQQQNHRINKEGYLILAVQEYRTQLANRKSALDKLEELILMAWPRPKQRKMRTGISQKTKEQRKEFKRRRGEVKESRRRVDF